MVNFKYSMNQVFPKNLEVQKYNENDEIEEICIILTNIINEKITENALEKIDVAIKSFNYEHGFNLTTDDFGVIRNTNEVYET